VGSTTFTPFSGDDGVSNREISFWIFIVTSITITQADRASI
jgi:hypothetical protein